MENQNITSYCALRKERGFTNMLNLEESYTSISKTTKKYSLQQHLP
ncbi:hypothetical protein [Bacillus sp. FJAT-53711]